VTAGTRTAGARRFFAILALVGAAAIGLRFAHLAAIRGTALYAFDKAWPSSDMYSNRAWAEHLAAGDWLDRDAYRPHFAWQDNVADAETWDRWFGHSTYYQPPLYTYLLAIGIRAAGSPDLFRWLQALLGGVNVMLIGLLGRRIAGPWAGLIAAAACAAYAPFILYDAELLRGTLVITFDVLALLALHRAASPSIEPGGRPAAGPAPWILAGAALGAAYLTDSAIVTFIPLALLWTVAVGRQAELEGGKRAGAPEALKHGLLRAGWLAAGLGVALVPLAARNIAVGAPILSTTTRAPLAFVMGNAPDATPVGAVIPESTSDILHRSDYGVMRTILATISAYHEGVSDLLAMQWKKLVGLMDSYEVPDNPSFYYAAIRSPVLAYGLRFFCLSGLGLTGLLLAARRPRESLLMYAFLVGFLSLFLFAHVVSRYRQPLVVPLAIYAGFALVEAGRALRERRVAVAAAILAGGVAISLALPRTPPPGYRLYRPAEFLVAASKWEADGDVTRAGSELREGIALAEKENAPAQEKIHLGLQLGELYLRHARYPEALDVLRDVLEEDPRNAEALAAAGAAYHDTNQPMEALQTLLKAESADPDNAEVQARLGHLYWVVFHAGDKALPHLRKALELDPTGPAAPGLSAMASQIAAATGLAP
jgi:tetratricopeptide (TPR) repeat protein